MSAFEPDHFCESVYRIPYRKLWEEGVRGLIFDIDNTLVPPDAEADPRSRRLFRKLRELGFRTCLVSNNRRRRVAPFAEALGTEYVCEALKPRKYGYLRAMRAMGTEAENTISIGDQLFTDIWGARRAGLGAILVRPMEKKEEPQILLKRILERPFLWNYFRRRARRAAWRGVFRARKCLPPRTSYCKIAVKKRSKKGRHQAEK